MPDQVKILVSEEKLDLILGEVTSLRKEVKELKQASPVDDNSEVLTSADIMRLMHWSRMTLHRRMYEGEQRLPMVKQGNKLIITKAKFRKYIEDISA